MMRASLSVALLGLIGCGGAPATQAPRVEAEQIAEVLKDANVVLLDVRNPEELEELGTIEGYVNIPVDELADRLDELPRDKPILTA
jgi:rhodanese-related sulfurtransferase